MTRLQDRNEDSRSLRTEQSLAAAMIQLLAKRGWERTGVRELCATAGIARSTFYLHYRGKEELLEKAFAALRQTVPIAAEGGAGSGELRFVATIAEHIFENRSLFLAIMGANGGAVVREKFRELIVALLTSEIGSTPGVDGAVISFLAGGFIELARHTMRQKGESALTFGRRFQELASAVLSATCPAAEPCGDRASVSSSHQGTSPLQPRPKRKRE